MRLLFIRHGEPDYEHDSLTEKGRREAALLAARLKEEKIARICVSPLGRARETAQATLSLLELEGEICEWLHEIPAGVKLPGTEEDHNFFDFLPSLLERYPALYSPDGWKTVPFVAESNVPAKYSEICREFDGMLARHGYVRQGRRYAAVRPNRDTLVFFCHFGITCLLLSHLFHLSPVPLLHHLAAAPSSITTVYTEEREKGIAQFRCTAYGDVSHLYAAKEPPSFAGRFCETFDSDERHD